MADGFCIKCGTVIESFDGLASCPTCKTTSIPCSYDEQVTINLNLHELRILCMWSERWVNVMRDEQIQAESAVVLRAIVSRLKTQIPEDANLLLCDDAKAVKDQGLELDFSFLDI